MWRYVCLDSGACHQRQLATADSDDDNPLAAIRGGTTSFTVTLDLSGDWAFTVSGIDEAIANYQYAQAQSPRRWERIGPEDRRALTALVSAIAAIQEAVDTALNYAPLPALKAGATWDNLAAATGDWTADECRAAYLQRVDGLEWPEQHEAEIRSLLDDD